MRKAKLLAATALTAAMLCSGPAQAQLAVTNPISDALSNAIAKIQAQAALAYSNLNISTLTLGFTQLSSYLKGQTASLMQITDASNTANAAFQRSIHNSDIVADHAVSPAACLALDGGQSATVAGSQADRVAIILSGVTDPRGEGAPGTPAYAGTGQAAEANRVLHLTRYCSQLDVEAGLCGAVSQRENGDQRAISIFGQPTYQTQQDIDAANDYAASLLQPTPPAALRADSRRGLDGAQAEQRRKNYNARVSLSRWVANALVSLRASSVVLTPQQQAQQRTLGRPVTLNGSAYEAIDLEVTRRYGNQDWNVALEGMQSSTVVLRELSRQAALQSYLTWTDLKLRLSEMAILAAMNSADADRDLRQNQTPSTPLPLVGAR